MLNTSNQLLSRTFSLVIAMKVVARYCFTNRVKLSKQGNLFVVTISK